MLESLERINISNVKHPFYLFKPKKLSKSVKYFLKNFDGEVIYSVKCNPSRFILDSMNNLGLKSFDVSSINEIKIVKKLFPDAKIYFMNPVKPRHAIFDAYFNFGVKNFAIDHNCEFKKIVQETKNAKDLNLFLRISISNDFSKIKLNRKFGVDYNSAPNLLKEIRDNATKVGITFHTGSQCMNPEAYKIGFRKTLEIVKNSNVKIDLLNIGGGFPSKYPGLKPSPLRNYLRVVRDEFKKFLSLNKKVKLLAEPGRCLVSECMSLIVRVDLRKGKMLFINEGIYGSLNNAGNFGFRYPVKLLNSKKNRSKLVPFSFYGPTCDSNDFMKGPFFLPDSIKEGDFIEIDEMGAYSTTMKTNFNGFMEESKVFLDNRDFKRNSTL